MYFCVQVFLSLLCLFYVGLDQPTLFWPALTHHQLEKNGLQQPVTAISCTGCEVQQLGIKKGCNTLSSTWKSPLPQIKPELYIYPHSKVICA